MDDDAGFTLVEMLVALVLLSMIAVMMGNQMMQFRPMRAFEQHQRLQAFADTVADVVAADLQQATPLAPLGTRTSQPVIGTAQSIEFSGVVPTGFERRSLRDVRYFLKIDPAGKAHLLRETKMRANALRGEEISRTDDLFPDIRQFRLQYLKRSAGGLPVWRDTWDREMKLPAAISLEIKLGFSSHVQSATRTVRIFTEDDPLPSGTGEKPSDVEKAQ